MKKRLITTLVFSLLLASCAAVDFYQSSFRLDRVEGDYAYYTFKTFAALDYPIDSEQAEETRIDWLKRWLEQNNLSTTDYKIIKREKYLVNKGLFASVYDLYYQVRVPASELNK
jgi:hypothetical protein